MGRTHQSSVQLPQAFAAGVDTPPGCRLSTSSMGSADFFHGGGCGIPDHLCRRPAYLQAASGCARLPGGGRFSPYPQRSDPLFADGWRLERRFLGAGFSAADSAAVPADRGTGGLGIPGARGRDRRPHHVPLRIERQGLYPAAFGIRLRGSGHHGDSHHREQARPSGHHHGRALHDVFGAPAGLHHGDRRIRAQRAYRGSIFWLARLGHAGALRDRFSGRAVHRARA